MNDQPTTSPARRAISDPISNEQAKRKLLETARSIDWLAPLREHPYAMLSVSAALGAAAGANPKSLEMTARLTGALVPVIEKATMIALRKLNENSASDSEPEVQPAAPGSPGGQ